MCYAPDHVVMFIDPGEVHCGWGLLDLRNPERLYDLGTDTPAQLIERLHTWLRYWGSGYRPEIRTVVVEEYRVYSAVNHTGSDMPVSRLIGRIEEICETTGRHYLTHPARVKEVGNNYGDYIGFEFHGRTQHEKDVEYHACWFLRGLALAAR